MYGGPGEKVSINQVPLIEAAFEALFQTGHESISFCLKILPSSLQIDYDGPLFDTTWHQQFRYGKIVDEAGKVV